MFWEVMDGFRVGLQTMAFMFGLCIAIEYVAPIERYTMKDRIPGLTFQVVGMFAGWAFMWPIQTLWQSMGATAWMVVPLWDWLKPLGAVGYALHFFAILAIADFLVPDGTFISGVPCHSNIIGTNGRIYNWAGHFDPEELKDRTSR